MSNEYLLPSLWINRREMNCFRLVVNELDAVECWKRKKKQINYPVEFGVTFSRLLPVNVSQSVWFYHIFVVVFNLHHTHTHSTREMQPKMYFLFLFAFNLSTRKSAKSKQTWKLAKMVIHAQRVYLDDLSVDAEWNTLNRTKHTMFQIQLFFFLFFFRKCVRCFSVCKRVCAQWVVDFVVCAFFF